MEYSQTFLLLDGWCNYRVKQWFAMFHAVAETEVVMLEKASLACLFSKFV